MADAQDSPLLVATAGPVCTITLNRPAALNSFTAAMHAVLLPALVNAHTHLEYATYGGFGDGLPFGDWLMNVFGARRPRLEPGDVEAAAALARGVNIPNADARCIHRRDARTIRHLREVQAEASRENRPKAILRMRVILALRE